MCSSFFFGFTGEAVFKLLCIIGPLFIDILCNHSISIGLGKATYHVLAQTYAIIEKIIICKGEWP